MKTAKSLSNPDSYFKGAALLVILQPRSDHEGCQRAAAPSCRFGSLIPNGKPRHNSQIRYLEAGVAAHHLARDFIL